MTACRAVWRCRSRCNRLASLVSLPDRVGSWDDSPCQPVPAGCDPGDGSVPSLLKTMPWFSASLNFWLAKALNSSGVMPLGFGGTFSGPTGSTLPATPNSLSPAKRSPCPDSNRQRHPARPVAHSHQRVSVASCRCCPTNSGAGRHRIESGFPRSEDLGNRQRRERRHLCSSSGPARAKAASS